VGTAAQDTADVIMVNIEDLRVRIENVELVEMEVVILLPMFIRILLCTLPQI